MRTKIESSGGRTSNRFKVGIRTGQVLHSGLPPKSKDKPLTRLYVGVDVHKEKHVVALIPAPLLPNRVDNWEEVKLLTITNNIDSYNRLNEVISSYISAPDEAAIAIDYTGGHYSEPLVYFLVGKGYRIYFLEPKAVKAVRERILDQESKSDVIDAKGAAYLLYLRDLHGLSFGVSAWTPEFGSQATLMRSIVLQRTQFTKLAVQSTHRLRQLLHAVFPEGDWLCGLRHSGHCSHTGSTENGNRGKAAWSRRYSSLGPGSPVCINRIHRGAKEMRLSGQHGAERQSLRECHDGEFFQNAEI